MNTDSGQRIRSGRKNFQGTEDFSGHLSVLNATKETRDGRRKEPRELRVYKGHND